MAIVLFFVLAENIISNSFHECVSRIPGQQSAERAYQHSLIIFSGPVRQVVCSLRLIDAHNGFFALLGTIAVAFFTFTLWQSTDKLWLADQQGREDTQRSIAEAARAAAAMQGVAESTANSAASAREVVTTNNGIAARQKLIGELQSRAYISVCFGGMVPNNPATGIRFEPRMVLNNDGATPAYSLTYRTSAEVLQHPLDKNFPFPLPEAAAHRSVSTIGPRQNKIIGAVVPTLYPDIEAAQIKIGNSHRIHIWGVVIYKDAFGIERFVKFSQSFAWINENTPLGFDTNQHNDAN